MNAVVLVIDRLGSGYLGPYGNTWIDTPAFNQLAARSLVFDNAMSDSPCLTTAYRSYWTALHALHADRPCPGLAGDLAQAGIHTALITDEQQVSTHPLAQEFAERLTLEPPPASHPAEDLGQTQSGELFASAIQWLESAPSSYCLWIHARGPNGPWDAPLEYRHGFAEEEEPAAGDFVQPPRLLLPSDFDPDQVLPYLHAYAGQVVLMDLCLAALLDALDQHPRSAETLLMVTSPRGFPLGEHGVVGAHDDLLLAESLLTPWIIKFPNHQHALDRSFDLIQPPDLAPSLLSWFDATKRVSNSDRRGWGQSLWPFRSLQDPQVWDRAAACHGNNHALRTPAWFWTRRADGRQALYAKPDDRWEANEVSDRCADIAAAMAVCFTEFQSAAEANLRVLSPLPEALLEPFG